jgi:hypothetical protein
MKKAYLLLFCFLLLSACHKSSDTATKQQPVIYTVKQAKVVKKIYKEGEGKQLDRIHIYIQKHHDTIRLWTSSKDMYDALSKGEIVDVWHDKHHHIQKISFDVSVGIE